MAATHGLAVAPSIEDRTTAPAKAPTAPGKVIQRTVRQSTLPKRQWETPETAVVPSSARWTVAEAAAGAGPAATSISLRISLRQFPTKLVLSTSLLEMVRMT